MKIPICLALLLRFFYALAVSTESRVILTNISNHIGIAVQLNGGLLSQENDITFFICPDFHLVLIQLIKSVVLPFFIVF